MIRERESIVHYAIPLSFTILDVLAGAVATLLLALTSKISWLIILLPILFTVRGDLTGVFVGVLTTGLKMGTIKPSFLNNTHEYYGLVSANLLLTASNSIIASTVILTYLSISRTAFNPFGVLSTIVLTFFASSLFSILVTSWIGFFTSKQASRYATDPDKYVYPVVSILNDIMIGVLLYSIANLVKPWESSRLSLFWFTISILLISLSAIASYKFWNNRRFRRTIKEAYLAILFGLFFSFLSGFFLESQIRNLNKFPPLLVVYPAFIALIGNMGVIITSQFTTMLWLGEVRTESYGESKSNIFLDKKFLGMAKNTLLASFVVLTAISILAQTFFPESFPAVFFKISLTLFTSELLIFLFLIYPISIYIALKMFEIGFDPDNFMISILTTISDTVGLVTLILVGSII